MKKILILLLIMATTAINAKTEPVEIQGAVGKLRGVVTTPDNLNGKKVPVVILFHGLTGDINEKMHTTIAESLAKENIASVRFDFNGHGESDGSFRNMTIDNEVEDARRIVQYVEKLPFVSSISILGHSQGGVVAILLSGELGKSKIKTGTLLAPGVIIHDDMLKGSFISASFDPLNVPEQISIMGGKVILGKEYILAGQRMKPFEAAKQYKGAVKLIHGTGDRAVPYSYSEYLTYFYKKSELTLIDRADHGFSGKEDTLAQEVTQWLKKQL